MGLTFYFDKAKANTKAEDNWDPDPSGYCWASIRNCKKNCTNKKRSEMLTYFNIAFNFIIISGKNCSNNNNISV